MNIDNLKAKHQSLIVSSNSEWTQILSLRKLVRYDFETCGFLSFSTFGAILDWKLRGQRQRTENHRLGNSAELIKELTGAFWRVKHVNFWIFDLPLYWRSLASALVLPRRFLLSVIQTSMLLSILETGKSFTAKTRHNSQYLNTSDIYSMCATLPANSTAMFKKSIICYGRPEQDLGCS